jgi:nicotinamide riboside kinase
MAIKTKKKPTTKKTPTAKNRVRKPRIALFIDVSANTRDWLNRECRAQKGKVSKSKFVESIFQALRTKPKTYKSLNVLGAKSV